VKEYVSDSISLNFKGVDCIGFNLPFDPSKIITLSLNYNNLKTLEGIEKFTALKSLHLNYNKIEEFHELLRIPNKKALTVLSIQGNPILSTQNILTTISLSFPSLEKLNGVLLNIKEHNKVLHESIELTNKSLKLLPNEKISLKALGKVHTRIQEIIKSDTYKLIMQDARKKKKEIRFLGIQQRAGANILLWYIQKHIQRDVNRLVQLTNNSMYKKEQSSLIQQPIFELLNSNILKEKSIENILQKPKKLNKTFITNKSSKKIKAVPNYLRPTKNSKCKLNTTYCS